MKCPKCNSVVEIQDHSIVGGKSNYWICPKCGEEEVMFICKEKLKRRE